MIKKQAKGNHNIDAKAVATFLNKLLADEYVLYTKTRNTHWNIEGSNLFELHVFLENQYNSLDIIVDDIAEQIHLLGHFAIGSLKDFLVGIDQSKEEDDFSNSEQIIRTLIHSHEAIIGTIRNEINSSPDKYNKKDIADFVTSLIKQHERMARKLNSLLSKPDSNTFNLTHKSNNQPVSRQV